MDAFPWDITLTLLGVLVPVAAALYEFLLVGRKRLGYRVQMDTPAFVGRYGASSGDLRRPSLVLIRIENNGSTNVDDSDYAVLNEDEVGLRVRFPERRVVRADISAVSDPGLQHSTRHLAALNSPGGDREGGAGGAGGRGGTGDAGVGADGDLLRLPKVPLNRGQYYKVLVLLDEQDPNGDPRVRSEDTPDAVIEGDVKGGRIELTRSRTGVSRGAVRIIASLVAIIVALYFVTDEEGAGAPLDCASGRLTLVGSTAFEPTLRDAAEQYARTCPGAEFAIRNSGSKEGLRELDRAGRAAKDAQPAMLAFSDGEKEPGYPQLLPRPVAFSLFTLVVDPEARVADLSTGQIRQIYRGEITNWSEVGGADMPVRLVGRYSNSGTRRVLEERVLGAPEPNVTSSDCRTRRPGATGPALRCERGSTGDVLDTVVRTPGALGYSALRAAAESTDEVQPVRIDGRRADLDAADGGAYPYWDTEYAYTYGEPAADSLAASFLRYLTNQVGRDIVRAHGSRPCSELQNPQLCHPEPTPPVPSPTP